MQLIKTIYWKLCSIHQIRIFAYIYYNFFCRNIIRSKGTKVIPYKGAVIDISRSAKIVLKNKNLEIGTNKIRGSKIETHIRLGRNSVWNCNNGCQLVYGSHIEVQDGGVLDTGFFFINVGSVMICEKHITLGDNVWMGRNVIIYDSDFHHMLDDNGKQYNVPEEVVIGNQVWLTNQIMVQKGVHIGDGAVIAPFSLVRKDIAPGSMIVNGCTQKTVRENIHWVP